MTGRQSGAFIRPEARAELWRWREALAGTGAAGLGLYWIAGPGGLLGWVGAAVCVAGVALAFVGVQRARFRSGAGGPGYVQVDEGQISYFGPLTGGIVATADLQRLTLDPTARPAHWLLDRPGQAPLAIPINAEGAEALFDVFATLPGLRTERMLNVLNGDPTSPVVIWQKGPPLPPGRRLH